MDLEYAPVASTSRLPSLSNGSGTEGRDVDLFAGAGAPTLAQLLEQTVRQNGAHDAELPALPSLSNRLSRAYISSLLGKDLPSLLREPTELAKQSEVLDADLANLCYRSTADLLGVGECVDTVEDGFSEMQTTLDSLLSCTEQLSSSCSAFTTSITPILSSRTRLNLVRSHISSIEDILSIPRLVSTCVRGGWWSEAMELAYRTRGLEHILRPDLSKAPLTASQEKGKKGEDLLGKVREEVEVEVKGLRARIIEGLRGRGLKLPSAVKSISLLRRMTNFALSSASTSPAAASRHGYLTEPELRLTFLASRWDCLRSQLEQLEVSAAGSSQDDSLRYVKRWIEVWREVVGETVTIYNEIFLQPSSTSAPSSSAKSTSRNDVHSPSTSPSGSDQPQNGPLHLSHPQSLLPLFLSQSLSFLQQVLSNQLPHITPVSSLTALQTQLSYCSTAFSKFGFDFRSLPNALISSRVETIILGRFTAAAEVFAKDLLRAQSQSGARGGKPRIILSALLAQEARESILDLEIASFSLDSAASRTSHPPTYVALLPPLAKLLNAHASALNELRLLPLKSIYPAVLVAQHQSLTKAAEHLLRFVELAARVCFADPGSLASPTFLDDTEDKEREEDVELIKRIAVVFAKAVVPWCQWALKEGVYPDLLDEVNGLQVGRAEEMRLKSMLEQILEMVDEQDKPIPASEGKVHQADEDQEALAGNAVGLVNGNGDGNATEETIQSQQNTNTTIQEASPAEVLQPRTK